jgi:hypothetical protein
VLLIFFIAVTFFKALNGFGTNSTKSAISRNRSEMTGGLLTRVFL